MADDLGADFLKGYFGVQEMKQGRIANEQRAQQFAAEMALKQQQFKLSQDKFDNEKTTQAAEQAWREAQEKHQGNIDKRADEAAQYARQLQAFNLQAEGKGTPVQPGAQIPVPGLPGMNVPQGMTQPGVTNFGGRFLRPTTLEEQAQRQSQIAIAGQQAEHAAKSRIAMQSLDEMAKIAPDSDFAKDSEWRQKAYAHTMLGIPMEQDDNIDKGYEKEINRFIKIKFDSNATPEQKAAAKTRIDTITPFVNHYMDSKAGIATTIANQYKEADLNREADDTAELRSRISRIASDQKVDLSKANAATKNGLANMAANQIDAERKANPRAKNLHPKALGNVISSEERGLATNPRGSRLGGVLNMDVNGNPLKVNP